MIGGCFWSCCYVLIFWFLVCLFLDCLSRCIILVMFLLLCFERLIIMIFLGFICWVSCIVQEMVCVDFSVGMMFLRWVSSCSFLSVWVLVIGMYLVMFIIEQQQCLGLMLGQFSFVLMECGGMIWFLLLFIRYIIDLCSILMWFYVMFVVCILVFMLCLVVLVLIKWGCLFFGR